MSNRITPHSTTLLPYADGGAKLSVSDNENTVEIVLSVSQTNSILRGLLSVATIEIRPDADHQ